MKKNLIVYGIGKYAEYVAYAFQEDSNFNVVAFCIEDNFHESKEIFGLPLVKFSEIGTKLPAEEYSLFVAVGNNNIRSRIFRESILKEYELVSYVSSNCRKAKNLKLGRNIFIDEGCVIQPFVEIEDNCVLFTTDIGHHSRICKNSLMSGAKTGGNVYIGESSYIGLNASIKQNVRVGENTIIGMNCAIEKDTPENSVYSNKGTVKRNIDSLTLGNRFLK